MSVVDGTDTLANALDHVAWHRKDSQAASLLVQTLDYDIMKSLVTSTTAHAMWNQLFTMQECKANNNIDSLQKEFFELKYIPEQGISGLIDRISEIISRLKDLRDTTFTSRAIIVCLLSGLPRFYNQLKCAWDIVAKNDQTLEAVTLRLLNEEVKLRDEATEDATTAFAACKLYSNNPRISGSTMSVNLKL